MTARSAALVMGLTIVVLLLLPSISKRCGRSARHLWSLIPRRNRHIVVAITALGSGCFTFGAYPCINIGELFARFDSLNLVPKLLEPLVTRAFGSQFAGVFANSRLCAQDA